MNSVFLLACLFGTGVSVSLTEAQAQVYAVRQSGLTFTPFKITQESTENPQTVYTLAYNCSAPTTAAVKIGSTTFDFCGSSPLNGTAAELNTKLQAIPIISSATDSTKTAIVFQLLDQKNVLLATQSVTFVSLFSLPVLNRVSTLEVNKESESADDKASFTIANIDTDYCAYYGNTGLKVVSLPNPRSFAFRFNGCKAVLTITDLAGLTPVSLNVTITDSVSGLQTNSWEIVVMPAASKINALSRLDFWVFVIISTAIITCFLMMLCYANSKANEYDKARSETNGVRYPHQDDLRNQSVDMKPNVLSESILTWNQQLMAKYQTKNLRQGSNFEKGMANILRTPANKEEANVVFVETKEDAHARPFEDISEIGTVDFHRSMRMEPYRKDDSFFDE
jgi:hypothetical protein